MLAYHNDPKVKARYLRRVARHRQLDQLVQGTGAEGSGKEFRGCAVGCTLNRYDHAAYPTELGVPELLARLEDRLFEGMSAADAQAWPERFLRAIPVGADLSLVWPRFAHWMLVDETHGVLRVAKTLRSQEAIQAVALLFERQIAGETVSRPEWKNAANCGYRAEAETADPAAATAATAASSAAESESVADAAAAAVDACTSAIASLAAWAASAGTREKRYAVMAAKLESLLQQAPV